jgi:phospholipid/cholesterol/gamma-HCH transport system substrate-binding protein
MIPKWAVRLGLTVALLAVVVGAATQLVVQHRQSERVRVVAYFENTNGVFTGDDVRIRGVNVGRIDRIEPQPGQVRVSFWVDAKYSVPADVKAVVLSPTLVTARAIQLTPPYSSGSKLADGAIITRDRTAVPIEWDDFRAQLQRLTATLQPTQPGGVSALGELINATADNLRGQGSDIRGTIVRLSQTISALSDHSDDTFTSVKNLATLVSALQDSTDLIRQLNQNLASVTGALANDPDEIADAASAVNDVVGNVKTFVADNRETLGTTSDKLTSISQALNDSLDDVKQLLHILPTTASNAVNLYQPAQGTLSGIAALNNFSNPITWLCGAIQAASRQSAEQSAKLCVQYLAPIVKNRQMNFPPLGGNPFVGAAARPNELTYSEDHLRPDHVPTQQDFETATGEPAAQAPPDPGAEPTPLPAEDPSAISPQPTNPAAGLPGMMLPAGGS